MACIIHQGEKLAMHEYTINKSTFHSVREQLASSSGKTHGVITTDENYIFSFAPMAKHPTWNGTIVEDTQWRVLLLIPEETILKNIQSIQQTLSDKQSFGNQTLIVILVIIAAVIGYLGWRNGKQLGKRSEALAVAAEKIQKGDLQAHVDTSINDEIGRSGRAFNAMADAVRESQEVLESEIAQRRQVLVRLQRVLNTSKQGICLIDNNHQIIDANPISEKMLHCLQGGTLPNTTILQNTLHTMIQEVDADHDRLTREITDENNTIFLIIVCYIAESSEYAVYVDDITEERRREQARNLNERLESLGKLSGGIAHDFNNQLTGILGYAHLLEPHQSDEKHQRWIKSIIESVESSAALTRQLLSFSRSSNTEQYDFSVHDVITLKLLRC